MKLIMLITLLVILSLAKLMGQLDKKAGKAIESEKGMNTPSAVEGDVIFSDGINPLLRITDEGTSGAIQFQDGIPELPDMKLYSSGSDLYFGLINLSTPEGVTSITELSDAKFHGSNLFMGDEAGANNIIPGSYRNTAVGLFSLNLNTSGDDNTALGYYSLKTNMIGINNTAVGSNSLKDNTGDNNTAIGMSALHGNISADNNTAIGSTSLYYNTSGHSNIALGRSSLFNNNGSYNTAIGAYSLLTNSEGNSNTAIGYTAGYSTTGFGNIFIGHKAGYNEDVDDKLYINNDDSSEPLIYGDFTDNLKRVVINGNGTHGDPDYEFFVNGQAGGNDSWNNLSDERLKKNISTISNALMKVQDLRGVNYEWENSKEFSRGKQIGFIAQEANKIIPEVVDTNGEYLSMQYAPITALLVEAIKEQQIIIKNLTDRIGKLEKHKLREWKHLR